MKNNSTFKIVICILLSGFFLQNAFSIPARPGPVCVTQPDGTVIVLYPVGDEYGHYLLSEDGYVVVENEKREYVYALQNGDGHYLPSEIKINPSHRASGQNESFIKQQKRFDSTTFNKNKRRAEYVNGGILPGKFPPKVLVILAEFLNVSIVNYEFIVPDPQQTFTNLFNQEGYSYDGATGSVRDYFRENSMGVYDPEFIVTGPVKLPRTKSYYGTNVQGMDKAPGTMVYDACVALAATGEIDFSEFDSDGDGEVDAVIVVYSGLNEADGAPTVNIWPIAGNLEELNLYETEEIYPLVLDDVLINRFIASSELRGAKGTAITGIGTVTHEMGHVLGLPDLYNTVQTNGGLLGWSLMANGSYNNDGRTPPYLSAYEREALGWGQPACLEATGEYTLLPVAGNEFYRINAANNSTEYFLLENRQQTGWDYYLEGHGMLIYHIDISDPEVYFKNIVNADEEHMYVDLRVADGVLHQDNYAGDPFPGATGKNAFDDTTSPSSLLWDGTPLQKPLSNITETSDGNITFYFDNPTSHISNKEKDVEWYVADHILFVKTSPETSFIELYNEVGGIIGRYFLIEGELQLPLSKGKFYIMRSGEKYYKIIL